MNELSDLLNEAADVTDAGALATHAAPETSPTVLDTDRWTRAQGAALVDFWKTLAEGSEGLQGVTGRADAVYVAADAMAALFEGAPKLAERPEDPARAEYWARLLETPEYRALHGRTMHQPELAKLAAAEIAQTFHTYTVEHPEPEPGDPNQPAPGTPAAERQAVAREAAARRSARHAAQGAANAVQMAELAAAGIGRGEASSLPPAELAAAVRLAASNPTLRAILQAAGRYRTRARTLQAERLNARRGIITGVKLSNDLGAALAMEQAAVAGVVPELELLAAYRFATGRLLTYEHQRREPVAAGPIVISVDESGSMSGDPIVCAKGIALAMAWVARQQRRACVLAAFAGTREVRPCIAEGGKGRPRASADELAAWCAEQMGGGTVADGPLDTIRPIVESVMPADTKGRTDHIIITDAAVPVRPELSASYLAWSKRYKVRTFVVVIGGDVGDLASVATHAWNVRDLSLGGNAVEHILSIGPE